MDGNSPSSPTPFTPPTTEEDRLSWLRLIRSRRVGPSSFARLMAEHGTAQAVLDALPAIARAAGVDDYTPCPADDARREIAAGRRAGAQLLLLGDPAYPAALAGIADAPPVLWLRGRPARLSRPMVAVVGARNASSLGGRMARKLAEGLGWHGFCVVSGLARGIDAAAHGAALKTGTLAVMAGGIDVIYPAENAALAAAIADQGVLLSEQPVGMPPQARHFPSRNRIVSGLARAVVVIEAAEGSGSLITARNALDQGREVLAVPGHPLDGRAAGCNQLIRDGAMLVRDVADIVELLGGAASQPQAGQKKPRSVEPVAVSRKKGASRPGLPKGAAAGAQPDGQAGSGGGATPAIREPGIGHDQQPRATGRTVDASSRSQTNSERAASAARRQDSAASIARSAQIGDQEVALSATVSVTSRARAADRDTTHASARPNAPDTLTLHRLILDALGPSPLPEDQLIRDLALPAACIAPALLFLELDGRVQRQPGGMLARS